MLWDHPDEERRIYDINCELMIPKIIHFCWLSGDPYPMLIKHCIRHWQRVMPGYEIRKWDTHTFDLSQSPWVREAFDCKKYAFAADYIRAYALYSEGGWYFDSDLWLKRDITPLSGDRFVSCMECYTNDGAEGGIQAAFLGSEAGHPFLRDVLEYYDRQHFVRGDGMMATSPIAPAIYADMARKYGFMQKNEIQRLAEGMVIYDSSVCAPNRSADSSESYAIHFCEHSWHDTNSFKRVMHKLRGLSRTVRIYLSD